jgi:outer membrane protein OmpA-like peptidoglycan-associated protein
VDIFIEKKFVLRPENVVTVFFDFDRHNLKPEALRKLDSVYHVLLDLPAATLQISGYTDGKGSNEYNKKLSDRRARACAQYFIQKGIAASRITFESFGACCPLEMELINGRDNPDGRSKNRRALINITKE